MDWPIKDRIHHIITVRDDGNMNRMFRFIISIPHLTLTATVELTPFAIEEK